MSRASPKILLLTVIVLGSTLLASSIPEVRAVGEIFTLTSVPSRTQEGNSTGIAMTLSVSNAVNPATYIFLWTVTDPSGSSNSITKTQVSTQSTWSLTANYPANFSGASINLVGKYNINITETAPSTSPGAALGGFQIVLTDSSSYRRTSQVLVKASGYLPTDNVTINIVQGSTSAVGFPTNRTANTNGGVSLSWLTTPATPLGNYTVRLSGNKTPPKNPPDSQWFMIYPTNVSITKLWTIVSAFQRSQTVEFRFNATYLNGVQVSSGSSQIHVIEPGGLISHLVAASYDSSVKIFRAYYTIPLNSQAGTWTGAIDIGGFGDGLGNSGPSGTVGTGFSVQVAALTVSVIASSTTYSSGTTIPIYAAVVTPGGGNFTQGMVTATITASGRRLIAPISLVYDPSRGKWSGSYKVNATDPSGTWLVTVNANDTYGNNGQGAASFNINTSSQQSQSSIFSNWFVLTLVLVIVGLGCGMLILRQRNVTRREVKLDIQAIKHQADQVKSDDFLQSIQAQLKKRTERMAQEKPKND